MKITNKAILLLITLIALFSLSGCEDSYAMEGMPHAYEIRARIRDDMPEYRFVAKGLIYQREHDNICYITGLDIYNEAGRSVFSTLISPTGNVSRAQGTTTNTMGLKVVDTNFDGYKDVILLRDNTGARGVDWCRCWLWDKETSSFVYEDSFFIGNPHFENEKKYIYSFGGTTIRGASIYKFIDDKFVCTNYLHYDRKSLIEQKFINGELQTVREVFFDEDFQKFREQLKQEVERYRNDEFWNLYHPRWEGYWSSSVE